MTDPVVPPGLSTDQLADLLVALEGSDSVELKLTVPDKDQRSAVRALDMDPLGAELRQVYFFDTPDLTLNRAGVIVRARRTTDGDDSVVKLRPVVPSELPSALRSLKGFGVEVDAMPGRLRVLRPAPQEAGRRSGEARTGGRPRHRVTPGQAAASVLRALRARWTRPRRADSARPHHGPEAEVQPPAAMTGDWSPSCGPIPTGRASSSCPRRPARPTRSRWPHAPASSSTSAAST